MDLGLVSVFTSVTPVLISSYLREETLALFYDLKAQPASGVIWSRQLLAHIWGNQDLGGQETVL